MNRVLTTLLLALFTAACGPQQEVAPDVYAPLPEPPEEVDAEATYQLYCALCHGSEGQGYEADGANALTNPEFLATARDDFIAHAIERGRPGTSMSSWGAPMGGPLSSAEVVALVTLIRSWATRDPIALSSKGIPGKAARAEAIYTYQCASCHGEEGEGLPFISLNNPEFLATATDHYIRHAIAKGRSNTPMPGFETQLTEESIDDLVALIRSWQTPVGSGPSQLPGKDLGQPVLNPGGPAPEFEADRYVPVDTVKEQYDAGAEMILLDARPSPDYATEHIKGAVSVPFYAVAEYLDQLPTDVTIVCYCACPHAESSAAADVLEANGYDQVKVIDEGFLVWRDRGYPTSTGGFP